MHHSWIKTQPWYSWIFPLVKVKSSPLGLSSRLTSIPVHVACGTSVAMFSIGIFSVTIKLRPLLIRAAPSTAVQYRRGEGMGYPGMFLSSWRSISVTLTSFVVARRFDQVTCLSLFSFFFTLFPGSSSSYHGTHAREMYQTRFSPAGTIPALLKNNLKKIQLSPRLAHLHA